MDKLYMVIPAYNEEINIETVAREWHKVLLDVGSADSRLVIVDDGSKDNTYRILCELKAELPQLEALSKPNGGHGAAVLFGYNYALHNDAYYIFQTDSDGQTVPSEFYEFWAQRNEHAAIIGYRNRRQDGFSRLLVTKTLKWVLFAIFGLKVTDANTPFRLMRRECLEKYITKVPVNYNLSNVLLTVLFIKGGEDVKFLPITFRPRQGGVNSINLKRIASIGIQAIKDFSKLNRSFVKEVGNARYNI